jgi:hypothetical protein
VISPAVELWIGPVPDFCNLRVCSAQRSDDVADISLFQVIEETMMGSQVVKSDAARRVAVLSATLHRRDEKRFGDLPKRKVPRTGDEGHLTLCLQLIVTEAKGLASSKRPEKLKGDCPDRRNEKKDR